MASANAYVEKCIADGAACLWLFDEPSGASGGFVDKVASRSMGIAGGTVTLGARRSISGINGSVADMTDGRWGSPNHASNQFASNAGSLEFWARRKLGTRQNVIKNGTHGYSIRLWEDGVNATASWYLIGTAFAQLVIFDPPRATVGSWEHWVGTWGSNQMRLYRNGALAAGPSAASMTMSTWNEALYLGGSGAGDEIDGSVTGLAIYKTRLTDAQILDHYKLGSRRLWTKADGVFVPIDARVKASGSFVDKPERVKVAGSIT